MSQTKNKATNMPVVVMPKEDDSRGIRLAELISARETFVAAEKEHRSAYKDVLKTYENDIKELAMEINSNQAPLFDSSAEVIDVKGSVDEDEDD